MYELWLEKLSHAELWHISVLFSPFGSIFGSLFSHFGIALAQVAYIPADSIAISYY